MSFETDRLRNLSRRQIDFLKLFLKEVITEDRYDDTYKYTLEEMIEIAIKIIINLKKMIIIRDEAGEEELHYGVYPFDKSLKNILEIENGKI